MAGNDHELPPERGDAAGDLDVWTLAGVIWARRRLVVTTALVIVGLTAAVLFTITPRYSSEAKIIIEERGSSFIQASRDGTEDQFLSDQAAVLSQVEVLSSRDLATKVADKLELASRGEFASNPAGESVIGRLMSMVGLRPAEREDVLSDRAIEAFQRGLTIYQIGTSRVIAVQFSSTDAATAAEVANTLSEEYIAVQRVSNYDSNQDAIAWLEREVDQLREKVREAEAKVADYRSQSGIYQTARDTSLGEQQLSELSAELIRASAAQSEAQTKARLINDLLEQKGSIEDAADVLNSQLIQRLREQQSTVSREHAELSATLLPGHPRMRELSAELADLEQGITNEARKIARGLENEAALAGARVEAIRSSLAEVKVNAGETSQAEVQLRALEREATAQREILETFLRRLREAGARQDVQVQPANARIISKASVASVPTYPPHGPILALSSVAGVLLGLMAAIVAEMAGRGRSAPPSRLSADGAPGLRRKSDRAIGDVRFPDMPAPAVRVGMPVPSVPQPPIGKRIARLSDERGVKRIALMRLAGAASSLDVAMRLAESIEANGLDPIVVELVPDAGKPQGAGLYDVLGGGAALGDVLETKESGAGAVIAAGNRPANGDELIRSGRLVLVVDALLKRYDIALLAAGSLENEVAVEISKSCDMALIAVPPGEVNGRRIKAALAVLAKAGIDKTAIVAEGPDALTFHDAAVRGAMVDAA